MSISATRLLAGRMTGDHYSLADLIAARPAWMALAACRSTPTAFWFPSTAQDATEAAAVCQGCPVRQACLDYATDRSERGIWAGTDERDRARIRRAQRAALEASPAGG